jgi:hypothetical protein
MNCTKFIALLFLVVFSITACKKSSDDTGGGYVTPHDTDSVDTTPPVVTLIGSSNIIVSLNSAISDSGATSDDGSSVTSDWSSFNPNLNLAGNYTITYSSTDAAGNTGTATRIITVRNDAWYLEGVYTCSEDSFMTSWQQQISASTTINNRIIFQKFANYTSQTPLVFAQVIGNQVLIPASESFVGGIDMCLHSIVPNGSPSLPITLVAGRYHFSVKYTDAITGGSGTCFPTAPFPFEDVCYQN